MHHLCKTFILIGLGALSCMDMARADIRYECHMVDDSTRLTVDNLSEAFPQAVKHCLTVKVIRPAVYLSPEEEHQGLAPIVDIEAPSPARWRPSSSSDPARAQVLSFASDSKGLQSAISLAARRHGLDPRLVDALIHVESRHQPTARSPKGAMGLMQIMPGTAERYGVMQQHYLLNPAVNLDVGVRYLRDLLQRFNGRLDLALAAYNAGEGNVLKYGFRVPPFAETQAYVRNIMQNYLSGAP